MKADEIKLHFQKLNEQRLEFALVDEIKKNATKFEGINANASSLYNQTVIRFREGLDLLVQTEKMINDGILKLKELGVEDKQFLSYKNELQGQKSKIENVLKKLN